MIEFIQIHLKTARCYAIMAQSMRSNYYLDASRHQLALARILIVEYKSSQEYELYNFLMAA